MDALIWNVVDKFFNANRGQQLVKHQLESFNDFIMHKLNQLIEGFNPLEIYHLHVPGVDKFKYKLVIDVRNPILTKPQIYEKDGSTKIMTPNDARERNFTYSSSVYVDIHLTSETLDDDGVTTVSDTKQINNVLLGKIPIMVKSHYCVLHGMNVFNNTECKYDYGGYHVINGNEKVIITQDRISENKTYVFLSTKISIYSHIAEIRSVQENKLGVPKVTTIKMAAKPNQFGRSIKVNLHHIKNDVPLFILFKALGLSSDLDIVEYITLDRAFSSPVSGLIADTLAGCMEEANMILCPRDALEYLSKYLNISGFPKEIINNRVHRLGILRQVLEKEFLPHVGVDFRKKALYLGLMVNKLMRSFLGLREYDDRDSYINKRVDSPGVLLANLFRQYYGKVIKDARNNINKEINSGGWRATNKFVNVITKTNVAKIFKSSIIDSGLRYALATGSWGIKNNKNKQGVAQILNRMTYSSAISHMRRVNTPIEKTGKLIQPRKLHPTQWGIICPAETPEGSSVGLVKNLAMAANVTISSNSGYVRDILFDDPHVRRFTGLGETPDGTACGDISIFQEGRTRLLVNGDIVGVTLRPDAVFKRLKQFKRSGTINIYTAVVWNVLNNELCVCTEGGRLVRPLFVVGDDSGPVVCNQLLALSRADEVASMSWAQLVTEGLVEFMDVEECNTAMIAMTHRDLNVNSPGFHRPPVYTHMEIHPSLILGVLASCIPFSDHNQAPRNCYQASQGKQALGLYTSNYLGRCDTVAHILNYPQKPIVRTRMSTILNNDTLPCGVNAIVAIATCNGYNQEDSVIMNQSAIDRGLFTSTYYRTYKEQNNKNHGNGEEEFFTRPAALGASSSTNKRPFNYDKLEDAGFVPENTFVRSGDIIIGKVMPNKQVGGSAMTYKDNSVPIKNNDSGYVDRNCYNNRYFNNTNGDGYTFCKVRLRSERTPTIGDKFSARSAQKGTVGMVYREEDLPFTAQGIVPDLIMNPHAIPSRMTIGQLLECIMGKACVMDGTYGDATPFCDHSITSIGDALEKFGMERYGNEIMYNPKTGQQMAMEVFIGPTFYQRLKHMVNDKQHCLLPGHDVLTTDGWIPIEEVIVDHLVASLASDGSLVYTHPLKCLVFPDFEGDIFNVTTGATDLSVTMNHRMWVSEFSGDAWGAFAHRTAADCLGRRVRYKHTARWTCCDEIEGSESDAWLTVFGTWIVAGYGIRHKHGCCYVRYKNERVLGRLTHALGLLGYAYTILSGTRIRISVVALCDMLDMYDVRHSHRSLPGWCWRLLTARQCGVLLGAMCTKREGVVFTSSAALAGDVMRLALHAGKAAQSEFDDIGGTWQINVGDVPPRPMQDTAPWVSRYRGPVYCLQVPSEVFFVRRGGKGCWTGNSRAASGPIVMLTRQPAEGRARDGGLRVGEMEATCIVAHGSQGFMKESFVDRSDNFRVFSCKDCGYMAPVNPEKNLFLCRNCKNTTNFAELRIPYATKLLFQELETMSIGAKFLTDK